MRTATISPPSNIELSTPLRSPTSTVIFASLAMVISYLPFSAANGTLGAIALSTGANTAQLQWVTDAFAIALAAIVLSAGVLGDVLGRRRVVLWGLALTLIGSSVALLSEFLGAGTIAILWAGQAVSGIGGGLVMSASLALIATVSPSPSYRARAISFWAAAVVVGLGTGPFLAGWVTATLTWQWMYLPIAALAIGVIGFGTLFSRESTGAPGRRFDLPGQVTSAIGIAALTFGVISGGFAGWMALPTIVGLTVGAASLLAFILIERRTASALLPLALFRSGGFTAAGIAATSVLFSIGGGSFVISLYLSSIDVDGLGIALCLGSLFGGNAIASVLAGTFQHGETPKRIMTLGLLLAAVGALSLISIDGSTLLGGFAWRLTILGFGSGLVMATSSSIAIKSVSGVLASRAGAANNGMRQFGAALGPAVLGGILSIQLATGGSPLWALRISAIILGAIFLASALVAGILLSRSDRS